MSNVKFDNNTIQVINQLQDKAIQFLNEAGGEMQAQAARNSRVDTGQLKSSWKYVVDESERKVVIGSPLENAIWEEFGTGEYAAEGGRKTPWKYKDAKGKWHYTKGKSANHTLQRASENAMPKIKRRLEKIMKG